MKKSLAYKMFRYNISYFIGIARQTYFHIIETLDIIKDHYLEKKLNIQTDELDYFVDNLSLYKDRHSYQPTPYSIIEKVMHFLKLKPEDIFIDFGSGKGRVVFFMALQRVKKVIGVESNKELIDIARRNLNNFKLGNSPIEFIHTDVATFRIKDENIFFMFNPFGYVTLAKVIDNIKDSLVTNPRQIHIIYFAPVHRIIFDNQDWLILEGKIYNNRCLIWRNKF